MRRARDTRRRLCPTEAPLVDWELMPGDIVTIECEHRGERIIALKVTVLAEELP